MSKNVSNLPPNKCKRCKNSVQSGLKCVTCGVISHKSCLNALKFVKFIDDTTVNCCVESFNGPVPTVDSHSIDEAKIVSGIDTSLTNVYEIKIKYLEELLCQKDVIISTQSIAINSLQEQLAQLKRDVKLCDDNASEIVAMETTANPHSSNTTRRKNKHVTPLNSAAQGGATSSTITPSALSYAIHSAQAHNVCKNVINLNEDQPIINERVKQGASNPSIRRGPRNILVGDSKSFPENFTLKSATTISLKHFHTTNWDPNTSDEVLSAYLSEIVPGIKVEKLNSRNPDVYASFKVSVPVDKAHFIMKPEIWPTGVAVNQFFRRNPNIIRFANGCK